MNSSATYLARCARALLAGCALAPAVLGAQLTVGKDGPGVQKMKELPPPVGTPKDFKLPARREFTLGNGMIVTLVPFGSVPKAAVRLAMRTGNIDEKADQVWLADFTTDMMNEGTTSRTASQIAQDAAAMGGRLSVSAGLDLSNVQTEVLSERAADAVRLVADVAQHPLFPASELARIRANRLRALAVQKSQPGGLALEKFRQTLYGDHPYGRTYPSEAMLNAYSIDQVKAFHAGNWGAKRAHLYVAGVFDQASTEKAIRDAFGGWASGSTASVVPTTAKASRTTALIDRPNAVQSTVYVGIPVPNATSADYMPMLVTDQILGGSFGSRITSNIREQKGYTYSPFSQVSTRYHDAYWVEVADVTTNVTGPSIKEVFGEIDRMRSAAPTADELKGIQNNMAGVFTLQNSSRSGIIGQLAFKDLQGLDDAFLTQYVKRVLAVTPADVQRMAQTYLVPGKMTLVVVGDRKIVEEQLAPWATVAP